MKKALLGVAIAVAAVPAAAQNPVERRVDAYNRCMMLAAVRAAYTDAATDRIFGIARAACAAARDSSKIDRAHQPIYLAAVDAADAARALHLPSWVADLRGRRRAGDVATH